MSTNVFQAAARLAARHGLLAIRPRQPTRVTAEADERARSLLARRAQRAGRRHLAIIIPEWLVPLEKGSHFHRVVQPIARLAARRGIRTTVVRWPLGTQEAFVHELSSRGYGAVLAIGIESRYIVSLHEMARLQIPLVLYNRRFPSLDVPAVMRDDRAASWRIGEQLVQRGHRNLAMVAIRVDESELGGHGRISGWLEFLSSTGLLDECSSPFQYLPPRFVGRFMNLMLRRPDRPTAVVLAYYGLAESILSSEEFARLRIPEDISVAAFDETTVVPPGAPPLTSIRIDYQRHAECIIETAERMIGGDLHPPTIRIPATVHVTDSIGPPP